MGTARTAGAAGTTGATAACCAAETIGKEINAKEREAIKVGLRMGRSLGESKSLNQLDAMGPERVSRGRPRREGLCRKVLPKKRDILLEFAIEQVEKRRRPQVRQRRGQLQYFQLMSALGGAVCDM